MIEQGTPSRTHRSTATFRSEPVPSSKCLNDPKAVLTNGRSLEGCRHSRSNLLRRAQRVHPSEERVGHDAAIRGLPEPRSGVHGHAPHAGRIRREGHCGRGAGGSRTVNIESPVSVRRTLAMRCGWHLPRTPEKEGGHGQHGNTTNRILAIPTALAAMPAKPNSAAISAMTKKTTASCSMAGLLDLPGGRSTRWRGLVDGHRAPDRPSVMCRAAGVEHRSGHCSVGRVRAHL